MSDTKKTYVEPVMTKLQDVTETTNKACGEVVTAGKQIVSSTMVSRMGTFQIVSLTVVNRITRMGTSILSL